MQLILIELNELNFNYIKKYFKFKKLSTLKKITNKLISTDSEDAYDLLEPWIQWHSIHTGLSANDHKIFRLGDSIFCNKRQIFEELEENNLTVGCVSPMNALNRLKNPSYFIPDPWTDTESDKSFFSRIVFSLLKDVVNNNASGKFSKKNYIFIILIFLKFVRIRKYFSFFKIFLKSFFGKWRKALFLDMLIHEIHLNLFRLKRPQFSCVFFNAAAHIQHHYLLNSLANNSDIKNPEFVIKENKDPFSESLDIYDEILKDYFNYSKNIIIATGLTQSIIEKPHYYYRLINHEAFLKKINIKFINVQPRMSRDFLINFSNDAYRDDAFEILKNIKLLNKPFFGILDKRHNSIFATLTYDEKINKEDEVILEEQKLKIFNDVVFVAIKNGFHNGKGFLYTEGKISEYFQSSKKINIVDIKDKIISFFNENNNK